MGMKHYVRFGLYLVKGSINVQLAEKTGFSYEDAQLVKECLRTLFENNASSARPEGSMEVVKLFWFEHNCKCGQYSSARVHRSVRVALKDPNVLPRARCWMAYKEEDYLQISGIQHFAFCRRQWALIHIENQWAENLRTVDGRILHERAHDGSLHVDAYQQSRPVRQ